MQLIWTSEQVLGLAPDASILRSSRVLAVPEKWESLTIGDRIISGRYIVPKREPFDSAVDLDSLTFTCSCKNRKFPCNHCIALLLMATDRPALFAQGDVPEYARRVAKLAESGDSQTEFSSESKQHSRRHRALVRGLAELQRWLIDVIRNGMATLPSRSNDEWDALARQLVDAHAPALAQQVRTWPAEIETNKEWAERLLRDFGRIQLLISAFDRFERLPQTTQNDLHRAVGWLSKPTSKDTLLHDEWLIIGQQSHAVVNRTVRQLYLQGLKTKQFALITNITSKKRQTAGNFATGTIINAQLRFFASDTPLHAGIESHSGTLQPTQPPQHSEIPTVISTFSQQLSRNPWIGEWPCVVQSEMVHCINDRWFFQDYAGNMFPVEGSQYGWHLKALENDIVCGLWNGVSLTPLSVWTQGRLLPLHMAGVPK